MAGNAIDELVSTLYEMIQDAGGVPLFGDRCVIEREKALDILDEIRANIPSDLKMAREIVEKRSEMIAAGKREAETIRQQAEAPSAKSQRQRYHQRGPTQGGGDDCHRRKAGQGADERRQRLLRRRDEAHGGGCGPGSGRAEGVAG